MKNISTVLTAVTLSLSAPVFGQNSPEPDQQDTIFISGRPNYLCYCEGFENFSAIIKDNNSGIQSQSYSLPYSMQDSGFLFIFPTDINASYSVSSDLDLDPLNGVNTLDLILISRHILQKEVFDSPFKLIAADADRSGTVTVFDIVELRKLIVGTYDELPNNSSWLFIDKNQVFTDTLNPFSAPFRHWINPVFGPKPWRADFNAIKIGDVDFTSTPNNFTGTEDRNRSVRHFNAIDKMVNAGEEFDVQFKGGNPMAGYQMTLMAKGLSVVEAVPEGGLTKDHFAVFSNNDRPDWAPVMTAAVETGDITFTVRFKAETAGQLSEMLSIGSEITPAAAFEINGDSHPLELQFIDQEPALQSIAVQPNPWKSNTSVNFNLPTDQQVAFKICDSTGKLVYSKSAYYTAGSQQLNLMKRDLPGPGFYFYSIDSETFRKSGKMELIAE